MSQQRPHKTVRVYRAVDLKDQETRYFTDAMGRAIHGVGSTRSVGSMALTLMGGTTFDRLVNRYVQKTRKRIPTAEFVDSLQSRLKDKRPALVDLNIEGMGLFGTKKGRYVSQTPKLGFAAILKDNPEIKDDLMVVNEELEKIGLETLSLDCNEGLHITLGEVHIERLSLGQGKNPNLLVPKGICIPETVGMFRPRAEEIIYNRATQR